MKLFNKKKTKEKPIENTEESKPKYYPNSLLELKPVVAIEPTVNRLREKIFDEEYNKQIAHLGSEKSKNAFLQGYSYVLALLLATPEDERFDRAYVAYKDLPQKEKDQLNS